jgi:magnesium transporter
VEGKLDALRSKKTTWVDCFNPTKKELEDISKLTGVPVIEFKEHLLSYERPTTLEDDSFSLIVFGAPVMHKDRTVATSFAIFLCKNNNIITIRTEEMEGILKFKNDIIEKNYKRFDSVTKTVQLMLELIIDTYFEYMDNFHEQADKIEAAVFKKPQKRSIEDLFKVRKSVLFFHKALIANREVLLAIEKQHVSRLTKKDLPEFRDLRDDVMQLIDTEDMLRTMLTGILDIYTSSLSNQLNQAMKKLTVIASYVLIPTLIASIYGMNFRFMPEIPWKWGYPVSLGMMIISIVAVYFYFKKSKML